MDRRRTTLLVLLFFGLLSAVAEAGPHWQFAGWYGGGCYPNIEFDPQNKGRVYLTSDVAGVWRSDDRGQRWEFATRGLGNLVVMQLAVSPSNSNVLYAATSSGIFRSDDAAGRWRACGRPIFGDFSFRRPENYRCLAVTPRAADLLAVGTARGEVYFSKNGGRTWRDLGVQRLRRSKAPITSLQWTADGEMLYAASAAGLAVYSKSQGRWTAVASAPKEISDFLISGGIFYAAAKDGLYISDNKGVQWRRTKPVENGIPYRVEALSPEKGGTIWVGWMRDWKGDVVRSADGGKTWSPESTTMHPDQHSDPTRQWVGSQSRISSVKVDPFDSQVLIRSDWWGVWRSEDGGAVWHEKITGAANVVGSDIRISPEGEIYVATMDNGLLKSPDEGQTYVPVYPSQGYDAQVNGHVWRVVLPAAGKVVATSSPWNAPINQVVTSADAGSSFVRSSEGLPAGRPKKNTMWGEGYPRALAADPGDPNRLYLGIDGDDDGGFFISEDGGTRWTRSAGQPGTRRVYNGLAVDPTNPNRLYWGGYGWKGGVYVSENRGKTWRNVFHRMKYVFDLAVAPDGTVYAAGHDRGPCVYTASPGGKGWRLLRRFPGEGSAESIAFDPEDPARVLVAVVHWSGLSGGKLYGRMRQGWKDLTGDLPEGPGPAALAFHPKNGYLYLISYAGSVYRTSFQELRVVDTTS